MAKPEFRIKTSKKNFILALALLLATNFLMGTVLMMLSKNTLQEQINQRMLDVAKTAAYQLNGDDMRDLKAEDKGTEKYERALDTLRSFQENIQLDYIYGIREEEDGSFTFTVDPDAKNPGEFGAPIETTEALRHAARGMADVDYVAHTDEWGRFYSAYCPIFDSSGNVAGIVGVDFNADWFDNKLNSNRSVAIVITLTALFIGIILAYFIATQNRRRFTDVMNKLDELDKETMKLDHLIMRSSIKKLDMIPDEESQTLRVLALGEVGKKTMQHEIDEVHTTIESVYEKLSAYLTHVDSEIYTDSDTGVSNKAAYKRKVKSISDRLEEGEADFAVAYFDINDLKRIYTYFGFEAGDLMMFGCAAILKDVYGKENIFHIAGDEFIIILENKTEEEMKAYFSAFDEELEKYNKEHEKDTSRLTVAKGYMIYDPEKHKGYRQVFIEAQKKCLADKADFHASKTEER